MEGTTGDDVGEVVGAAVGFFVGDEVAEVGAGLGGVDGCNSSKLTYKALIRVRKKKERYANRQAESKSYSFILCDLPKLLETKLGMVLVLQ